MRILEIKELGDLAVAPKANAFRVLDDGSSLVCFLDFLVYDPHKNKASVVSRVKINRGFLPTIRDRLNLTLQDITDTITKDA